MTSGKNLARWCKAQIGKSYSEMDCIGFIVNGIRKADGANGESLTYRSGGTNELWRSLYQNGKYRYVTEIVTISEAKQRGMLVPGRLLVIWEPGHNEKYNDDLGDCSHIGVFVGDADCEAVHSSYTLQRVAATTVKNGFTHVLSHRLIDLTESSSEGVTTAETPSQETRRDDTESVKVGALIVMTEKDPLNVRDRASIKGTVIGKVARGALVTATGNEMTVVEDGVSRTWVEITFTPINRRGSVTGFACGDYLMELGCQSVSDALQAESSPDYVTVPRSVILALADAVNETEGADGSYEALMDAVRLLRTTACDVTAYLEGDD